MIAKIYIKSIITPIKTPTIVIKHNTTTIGTITNNTSPISKVFQKSVIEFFTNVVEHFVKTKLISNAATNVNNKLYKEIVFKIIAPHSFSFINFFFYFFTDSITFGYNTSNSSIVADVFFI